MPGERTAIRKRSNILLEMMHKKYGSACLLKRRKTESPVRLPKILYMTKLEVSSEGDLSSSYGTVYDSSEDKELNDK